MNLPELALSGDQIDELALRRPSAATLQLLRVGQAARRRLLLLALRTELADRGAAEAFALLARAAGAAPAEVEELVTRPLAGAAAVRALRTPKEAGYVRALAAAAAIRAGLRFSIDVPDTDGSLFLPGVGTARDLHCRTARVTGDLGAFSVGCPHRTAPGAGSRWSPHRFLTLGDDPSWRIDLEDHDPDRACFDHRPAEPLGADAVEALQSHLNKAWRLIAADHPGYALVVRTCLRAVVPLADPEQSGDGERAAGASSSLAFGSVALSRMPDPHATALMVMHELQHNLLDAAFDLADFTEEPARELHHAPWRLDPRPVRSLLQGVHAHAAVTDYWAVRWRHDGSPGSGFEFAFWREVTTAAIGTLRRSAELTPAGRRLVRGMWRATEDWWRADPSPELAAAARQVTTADAVRWRLRNRGTAPDLPESLKDSLLRGERCPVLPPPIVQQADPEPARHTRIGAAVRRSALRGAPSEDGDELDTWRATVAADPDDEEAWAALAHQLTLRGRGPAATALIERPEIVRAVLLAGRADPAATEHRDPVRIAAWVAEGDDQVGDTPDSAQYYR